MTASVDCAAYDAVKYKAGTNASRACSNAGEWETVDVTACIWVDCTDADGVWADTNDASTASVLCNLYDAVHYSDTKSATRGCTQSAWGDVIVSECELATGIAKCAAGNGYTEAFTNQKRTKLCTAVTETAHMATLEATADTAAASFTKFTAGNAEVTCTNAADNSSASFSDPDVSGCTYTSA